MACGAANGQGYIWNVATGKIVWRGDNKSRWTQAIAFAPDGKQFVSISSKDEVTLWDVASWKPVGRIPACSLNIVKFSPDGKTLALFELEPKRQHGMIGFWDVATKRRVAKAAWRGSFFYDHPGSYVADFSPDGRLFAWTEGGNQIHLTEVASGKDAAVSRTSQHEIMALAFSPDGSSLAFEEDDGRFIPLWSLASRTVTRKLAKKGREISSPLTFSPRENFLATNGSHADTLCLWDLRNGKRTPLIGAEVDEDLGRLTGLVFSPDGSMLIAGFNDRGGCASGT